MIQKKNLYKTKKIFNKNKKFTYRPLDSTKRKLFNTYGNCTIQMENYTVLMDIIQLRLKL